MQLSDIHPGAEIEYWCQKNKRAHHIRIGTVKQVTPRMIAIQGKRYPDTILVNDLLSGQAAIVKIKQEGEAIMSKPKQESPTKEDLKWLWVKHNGKINPVAKELGKSWHDTRTLLTKAGIINSLGEPTKEEEQTPTPAPVQAANQAPDKGSAESAPTIIPEPEYAQKPERCPDPFADMGLKIMADAWVKALVVKDDPIALALMKELIEQGAV